MKYSDSDLELSELSNFISHYLRITEITKHILQFECDEAKYVLRPWRLETLITKEIDESHCICNVHSLEMHDKNIAHEIDKTIIQAQKLRQNSKIKNETINYKVQKETLNKNESTVLHKKKSNVTTSSTKLGPKILKSSIEIKKKGSTNFILINKQSIKEASLLNRKIHNAKHDTRQNQDIHKSSVPKARLNFNKEINTLIEKISELPLSTVKNNLNDCPFHNKSKLHIIEESVIKQVLASEALKNIKIPPTLGKILRLRHSFLEITTHNEDPINRKRENQAREKFNMMFNNMKQQQEKIYSNSFAHLLTSFITIFRESFNTNMDFIERSQLGCKFTNFSRFIKDYNWKNRYKFQEFQEDISYITFNSNITLISNGLWNDSVFSLIKDMGSTNVICYSNKDQLVKIYNNLQQLQRFKYQEELISVIKICLHNNNLNWKLCSKTHLKLYQMLISILYIINLRTPVFSNLN